MTFDNIENIWLRRATILLIPVIYPPAIVWAVLKATCHGAYDLGREIRDVTILLWNPKRKRY